MASLALLGCKPKLHNLLMSSGSSSVSSSSSNATQSPKRFFFTNSAPSSSSISKPGISSSCSSCSCSFGLDYYSCSRSSSSSFHGYSSLSSNGTSASLSKLLQVKRSGHVRKAPLHIGARAAAAAAAGGAAPPSSNDGITSLIVAVGIPLVLGIIDSVINNPASQWYKDLKKPRWQPPSFLFGGAWGILYPLIGLASWLVWAEGGWAKQSYPLTLYGIQLALNLLWPALFFGARNLGLALVDIVALVPAIVATLLAFNPVSEIAANLLKPYLAWVLFATALNYKLWDLNKQGSPSPTPPPPPAAPQQQY